MRGDTQYAPSLQAATESGNALPSFRRVVWAILAILSAALFAGSVYRAIHFPFTHDESLSFAGFHWEKVWAYGANNHLLNTFFMKLESRFLGDREIFLRLHTLGAHLAYMVLCLLLLRRLRHPALIFAGFLLLNINPYLLDFFFVARGYGLALAFVMGSLVLLVCAFERKRSGQAFSAQVVAASFCAILATFSNYSFVNFHVPTLLVCAWLLLTDERRRVAADCERRSLKINSDGARRPPLQRVIPALVILVSSAACLLYVLKEGLRLKGMGDLFYGGKTGFIPDTIGWLIRCGFYSEPVSQTATLVIAYAVAGIFFVLVARGAYPMKNGSEALGAPPFLFILGVGAAMTVAEHYLLHTFYPVERWAFCFVPPYVLAGIFSLDREASSRSQLWAVLPSMALSLVLLGHFLRDYSVDAHYSWGYDRHTPEVMEIIDRDRRIFFPGQTPIEVGSNNAFEPSLNFYRFTRRAAWVARFTRLPLKGVTYHYLYLYESEVTPEIQRCSQRIVSFKDTQSVILRLGTNPG